MGTRVKPSTHVFSDAENVQPLKASATLRSTRAPLADIGNRASQSKINDTNKLNKPAAAAAAGSFDSLIAKPKILATAAPATVVTAAPPKPAASTLPMSAQMNNSSAAFGSSTGTSRVPQLLARQPPAKGSFSSTSGVNATAFSFSSASASLKAASAAQNAAALAVAASRPSSASIAPAVDMKSNSAAAAAAVASTSSARTAASSTSEDVMNMSIVAMDDDDEVNRSMNGLSISAKAEAAAAAVSTLSSVDIDDRNNAQMCSEYIDDIMSYFKANESRRHPNANYLAKHADINPKMREILIDWLIDVHLKFKLQTETLFLAINYVDRFLERRQISRNKLQLLGCTALLLASKYEEMYAPEVKEFVTVAANAFTRADILSMEAIILSQLEFNLTVPTAHRFAQRYCKVARSTPVGAALAHYLVELTLQEYRMLRHLPSMIAASAVCLAQIMQSGASAITAPHLYWTSNLVQHTGYSLDGVKKCVRDLHALLINDQNKYIAVRRKYAADAYLKVSTIAPPAALPF